jgi:hypothetical protein
MVYKNPPVEMKPIITIGWFGSIKYSRKGKANLKNKKLNKLLRGIVLKKEACPK